MEEISPITLPVLTYFLDFFCQFCPFWDGKISLKWWFCWSLGSTQMLSPFDQIATRSARFFPVSGPTWERCILSIKDAIFGESQFNACLASVTLANYLQLCISFFVVELCDYLHYTNTCCRSWISQFSLIHFTLTNRLSSNRIPRNCLRRNWPMTEELVFVTG